MYIMVHKKLPERPKIGGFIHINTFTYDVSFNFWVYFLKQKFKVFSKFKLWKEEEVENCMEMAFKNL